MKGIVLAGGCGSRLYPLTLVTSKQLLPIYDKPMIYYPLSVLMLAGIRDILIISTPYDLPRFKSLLGDGSKFGIHLDYQSQKQPDGLAQAFLIGESFIGNSCVCMILGDNIFYGNGLRKKLRQAVVKAQVGVATIFGYYVSEASRFGVVEFDKHGKAISIEEKPKEPKSQYAVTGLYFYDQEVVHYAKMIEPSNRGELEITDINQLYLKAHHLEVETLGRGYTWMDAGTHESLIEAAHLVRLIEQHQGLKISCPEEIAYINGWISRDSLLQQSKKLNNQYGNYLKKVADGLIHY